MDTLLKVQDLSVGIEDKQILDKINLEVKPGEIHVIMGPNGAGKSTLGFSLMGHPDYNIIDGSVQLLGEEISDITPDKRAKKGLFLSFQIPVDVPGITVEGFLRGAIRQRSDEKLKVFAFRKKLEAMMELLDMDPAYADRDLNVGFSGGERKKSEILQMLMLEPKLAILDETDSGLDVDAARTVSKGIKEFQKNKESSLIIITHSTRILESLKVDYTHILVDGKIVRTGDASLIDEINESGYEKYLTQKDGE